MKKTITLILFGSICSIATARYGINESIGDQSEMPSWLLPLALIALLIWHFKEVSRLQSESAKSSFENSKLRSELSELRKAQEQARTEVENISKDYMRLHGVLRSWLEGELDEDEFVNAIEPFVE